MEMVKRKVRETKYNEDLEECSQRGQAIHAALTKAGDNAENSAVWKTWQVEVEKKSKPDVTTTHSNPVAAHAVPATAATTTKRTNNIVATGTPAADDGEPKIGWAAQPAWLHGQDLRKFEAQKLVQGRVPCVLCTPSTCATRGNALAIPPLTLLPGRCATLSLNMLSLCADSVCVACSALTLYAQRLSPIALS